MCVDKKNTNTTRKLKKKTQLLIKNILSLFIDRKFPMETTTE